MRHPRFLPSNLDGNTRDQFVLLTVPDQISARDSGACSAVPVPQRDAHFPLPDGHDTLQPVKAAQLGTYLKGCIPRLRWRDAQIPPPQQVDRTRAPGMAEGFPEKIGISEKIKSAVEEYMKNKVDIL